MVRINHLRCSSSALTPVDDGTPDPKTVSPFSTRFSACCKLALILGALAVARETISDVSLRQRALRPRLLAST